MPSTNTNKKTYSPLFSGVFLGVICVVLAGSSLLFVTGKKFQFSDLLFFVEQPLPEAVTSISFVGDLFLGRDVETKMRLLGVEYPFAGDQSIPGEFRVANFEASAPNDHQQTPDFTFSFSVDQQFFPVLYEAGYRYLSLSNNHALDKGPQALAETVVAMNDAHMVPFGTSGIRSALVALAEPTFTVAITGFNDVTETVTSELIQTELYGITQDSDYQIAYVHWGEEYQITHNIRQAELARVFIDAGYDAVIGHHPHVVQDIEVYKNAPIFYSLGNYIFDQYFSDDVQRGLRLAMTIEGGAVVYKLIPVTSQETYIQPRPVSDLEQVQFLTALAARSQSEVSAQVLQGRITQQIK